MIRKIVLTAGVILGGVTLAVMDTRYAISKAIRTAWKS